MAEVKVTLVRGMRVRAEWLEVKPVALAGAQMKLEGTRREVVGTVEKLYGNDPVAPDLETLTVLIRPDDGGPAVEVPVARLTNVFDADVRALRLVTEPDPSAADPN